MASSAGWRGWLRIGGRCGACHAAVTPRWWAYVAATAVGFLALTWRLPTRRPAEVVLLVAWLLMTALGVVLAGIDVRVHRLPRPILAGASCAVGPLVSTVAVLDRDPGLAVRAGLTSVALGGVYLILALIGPGLVGLGNVYLAAVLGLLLGTGSMAGILAGALGPYLIGTPVTATRLALRQVERTSVPSR
jgi:leader peptidase (prepilin peptidase) / N-methyltransferase